MISELQIFFWFFRFHVEEQKNIKVKKTFQRKCKREQADFEDMLGYF